MKEFINALRRTTRNDIACRTAPAQMKGDASAFAKASVVVALTFFAALNPVWSEVTRETEELALAQKWEELTAKITADDSKTKDPIARFLVAHACLARNRNNEAMLLFMTLREAESAKQCLEWTGRFSDKHPNSATAHYFHGDSLARGGQLKEAIVSFDRAVKANPGHVLSLSARGAARAVNGDFDGALLDLVQATELRPDLADAHANLGTLWILRRAAPGAVESFDRALKINPDFALAYNGRGCARFGQGDYDTAIEDLRKAYQLCPSLLPAAANEALVLVALAAECTPERVSTNVGTTITVKSELATVDFARLPEDKFVQLAKRDPAGVIQAISAQKATFHAEACDILQGMQQRVKLMDAYGQLDTFLKWFDVGTTFVGLSGGIMKAPTKGWQDFATSAAVAGAKGVGREGLSHLPAGPGRTSAEFALATANTKPWKMGLGAMNYTVGQLPQIAREMLANSIDILGGKVTLLATDSDFLTQRQHVAVIEAINQKADFGKLDPFGMGTARTMPSPTTTPVREYRIPAAAPLTWFGVLPGATGKSIAPPGQRSFVLVEGGDLTDPARLGTALNGYGKLGAQTIPVPKGVDSTTFMRTLGLSSANTIVMKVTAGADTNWRPDANWRAYSSATSKSPTPPGGVTTESHPRLDRGDWPVVTTFLLAYSPPPAATTGAAKESAK